LPLPLWLWVGAAGATVVVTFVVMALFVRSRSLADYPRVDLPWLDSPAAAAAARLIVVAAFVLTLATGFLGVQDAYRNLTPTVVWVLWWVGFAFVCVLLGDLWALVNPLRTLFAWGEALYAKLAGGRALARELAYPPWLGAWPALLLFLGFAWAELVWRSNDVPGYLARAMLAYAALAWLGMFLYGRETWLRNGEAFSVAFGVLSRLAPLAAAPRPHLRAPGAGLLAGEPVSPSYAAFVLLMLATVSFDGFLETPLMQRLESAILGSPAAARALFELSAWGLDETQLIHTAALAAFALGFFAAFRLAAGATGTRFVLTLVPIAVAYHLAHYFSLLVTAGQFVIPLASDPFGFGWDLFGTADYKVDLGLLSPYVFWYGAVALVVIGHVIAVFLAHVEALRLFGSRKAALASQVPMVALMVAYTMLSLWILAQPVVG
jgi:hypothetical protein